MLAGVLVARGELDAAEAEIEASGLTAARDPGRRLARRSCCSRAGSCASRRDGCEEAAADLLELERRSKGWG